jgi:3-dehydroquinate synthase
MPRVVVRLPGRTCPIDIGSGNSDSLGERLRRVSSSSRGLIVADARAWRCHGGRLQAGLGRAGRGLAVVTVLPGERSKSLGQLERLYGALLRHEVGRDGLVVAVGGGVVGDLAGLAAAGWHRGIDLVMVPTTLLAQVDSAVGGKTAVNFGGVKNVIGAFHQPRFVLSDVGLLSTLADRDYRAGLAEVVKYGMIADAAFFARLERGVDRLLARDPALLVPVVTRCSRIKAAIVGRDEREAGERITLNFGHTLGHALEAAARGRLRHGEAVALGMRGAARLAEGLGWMTRSDRNRLESLLDRLGLPAAVRLAQPGVVIAKLKYDKKVRNRQPRFVLTRGVGSASVAPPINASRIRAVLADLIEA